MPAADSNTVQISTPQATIEQLRADPETAEAVRAIQRAAIAMIDDQTDALILALGRAKPAGRIQQTRLPVNVRELANTSRHANAVVQGRRKFARDILIATLINRDNDDWNMDEPSSWHVDPDDLLLALMAMLPLS